MKKIIPIAFVVTLIMVFCACGNKNKLTIYTWNKMFPEEILKGFEAETGIKINYVNFDTDEAMLENLNAKRGGSYDLVIVDDYIIEPAIKQGLAQKLDVSKLTNYKNINPIYQGQFYDPSDEYTIPYGAGVQTIVYDPSRVNIKISGYTDLWNPSLANSVGITGNFRVINGMALKVLGESYNTNDIQAIRTAGDMLINLAPNIRLIMDGERDDYLDDELLSGKISVGVMYTSQVTTARMENPSLKAVFPREGIGFGIMAAFIPSKAPNPNAAHLFLNYILDAERGAVCFEYLGYYSTYSASDPLIAPEYKEFLTLPERFHTDMEMIQSIEPEAVEAHNLIWTAFRAAAGHPALFDN